MIKIEKFIKYLKSGEIPPEPPVGTSLYGRKFSIETERRSEATERGMWAIVDKIWTKNLANWIGNKKCLEVMAGAGWLAKALNEYEIDIIATDNGEWDKRHSKMIFVHNIEKLSGIKAVKKYSNRDILIVSWPPYEETEICQICKKWGSKKPIIYIGEGVEGCNAPNEFFNNFQKIDDPPEIPWMAWNGIHDSVIIGYYKLGM